MLSTAPTATCMYRHVLFMAIYRDDVMLYIGMMSSPTAGDFRSLPQVTLNLDIAAQHHRTVIGSGGGNIRKIMEDSGTT